MSYRHPDREQLRIDEVLTALGNPVRLEAVRILNGGGDHNCSMLQTEVGIASKSTMTHHWRVLRESGIIWQRPSGRETALTLRREDLDARYPGLLDSILTGRAIDAAGEPGA
ncbi:helix-turn-helix transcriptional regulator [Kribbella qitaiheensis]|uniref:Helix-turn-helix transcriptional regulator n=1 Tax=Kribbella qitaiheensis TaxID=1544730 RepID=A0A7G6X628_9ACTN|nr:helix-turn-helix transcriptional regulator [Kribbella qitaiheensis]QNE21693.1 helix-turn-helix transcriptional regulator [Kribbella qitaiheensis]